MAELVNEDDDAESEEEGERVAEELHGGVGAEDGACSGRGVYHALRTQLFGAEDGAAPVRS